MAQPDSRTYNIPLGGQVIPLTVTVEGQRLKLSFRYHPGLKDEVKASLEGSKWNPDEKIWSCRNSPRNWYVISQVWMDTEQFNRYYNNPPAINVSRYPLWENQKQAVSAWIYRKRLLYTGKMGTGKMLIAFAGCDYLMQMLKTGDIWWVTSEAGFKAFDDQYEEWKPIFYPRVRSTFTSLAKEIDRQSRPPQILVIDESAALKTLSAIQTQAALGLSELMERAYGDSAYILALTGTPEPKDLSDWWSQCEVVRPGFIREKDIHTFKDRYAYMEERESNQDSEEGVKKKYKVVVAWKRGQQIEVDRPDENGMTTKIKITLSDECGQLPKRLAGLVMRHDERDLPIEVKEKKYVVMHGSSDPQGSEYKYYPELTPSNSILQVAESIANSSVNTLQALGRLRQLADGFQYGEDGTKYGASAKMKVLKKILQSHREHGRTIIYAAFTASIDKLVDEVQKEGWAVIRVDGRGWTGFGCPADLRTFQDRLDNNYPIAFIAHPKSGGEAITLTAADSIHFYSNTFEAKVRWQAEMRVRFKACTVYDYLHLPSDFRVYNNIRNKKNGSELTLEEIRRLTWIALGKNPEEEAEKLQVNKVAADYAADEE